MRYVTYGEKDNADICLIQMADDHDMEYMQREYELITGYYRAGNPLLVAVHVDSWNHDLSPWEAPAVFGDDAFGNGAGDTLEYLRDELLPVIKEEYFGGKDDVKCIIGGYSLAGLFALWAAYQTDIFCGCSCASPSVWFPGWIKYAKENVIKTDNIYLSLGKKEPKTKNQVMRMVGDSIIKQDELMTGKNHILEWNEGNHFTEPDVRTAKGFIWVMQQMQNPTEGNINNYNT